MIFVEGKKWAGKFEVFFPSGVEDEKWQKIGDWTAKNVDEKSRIEINVMGKFSIFFCGDYWLGLCLNSFEVEGRRVFIS